MGFDWNLALLSLIGGLTLLISASLTRAYEKTIFAPATAMLLTWGSALVALAFLPMQGFYHLSIEAILLYVLGAEWFALIAIFISWVLKRHTKQLLRKNSNSLDYLNFKHLYFLWIVIALVTYPLAILNILDFGSSITEISFNIRVASVAGEDILQPVLSNLLVLLGVLTNVILFGVIHNKVKLLSFIIPIIPLILISLIVAGRSGLVSLTLGWLVIFAIFSDKLKFSYLVLPIIFLLFTLYFGGVWVKKFDIEDQSVNNTIYILFEHVFQYLYQGPVLFSQYFINEINISTNWDFLNSACHMLSKIGICEPKQIHADFANYGPFLLGNVYSMYFSIIPEYGLLGLIFVFSIYSIFLSTLFYMMKARKIFAIVVYPIMFSAIILSVYKDGIGYSFYWLIKVFLICILIKFFFVKKTTTSQSDS